VSARYAFRSIPLPLRLLAGLLLAVLVGAVGWKPGQVASGTGDALRVIDPVAIEVPAELADRVTGPTALFYFSPTCPHCRSAMPEIQRLTGPSGLAWIAVASGNSAPAQIEEFRTTFGVSFPIVVDSDQGFKQAVGARSTPSVYIVAPSTTAAKTSGKKSLLLTAAYAPFSRGVGAVLLMRLDTARPFAHFQGYQGATVCVSCHREEGLSWALTHHAAAYRTLARRDREKDLACVGCHVTGMNAGGFDPADDPSSPFIDVTCESCHGPSGPHDGVEMDATTSCVGCHDAEHSVAFDLERALPHIDHYAANGLDEATFQARRAALLKGEAPRPLLAFPEGPTVGAAACKECHKAETKHWAKTGHAHAMDVLEDNPAADPSCTTCHATPTHMGANEATGSFRTDEGVGCESCHGAGAAHVKQPTVENIVGLGETCPECVIEGICTSCHTMKWDPAWELGPRLDAIRH
jgi:hypothetical protein